MKLAWLCYREDEAVIIEFVQPERWRFDRIVQIVYAEIEE